MNYAPVEAIEGELLYPGSPRRWSFGPLFPRAFARVQASALCCQQLQCLVEGDTGTVLEVRASFLQPQPGLAEPVPRVVEIAPATLAEIERGGQRRRFACGPRPHPLSGELGVTARRLDEQLYRVTVRLENLTSFRAERPDADAGDASMLSAHCALGVEDGRLVSLIDPPPHRRAAAAACVNRGCFPVLVGDRERCDTLLASPVILRDFPEAVYAA